MLKVFRFVLASFWSESKDVQSMLLQDDGIMCECYIVHLVLLSPVKCIAS